MPLTNHPYATIIGTYHNRPRHPLEDADYNYYTFKWEFGTVYINYCEVGKPLLDVFKDQDELVGDDNIRPLHYYSADFQIKFGPSTPDNVYMERLNLFNQWWDIKSDYLKSIGLVKNKKLALGMIPVAKLNKDKSQLNELTDVEIVQVLSTYQTIKATEICTK